MTDERSIRAILDDLVLARRRLERDDAGKRLLAANGQAIAYWQRRLAPARDPAPDPNGGTR